MVSQYVTPHMPKGKDHTSLLPIEQRNFAGEEFSQWWDTLGSASKHVVGSRQPGHLSKGPFSPRVEQIGVPGSGDNCSCWKWAKVGLGLLGPCLISFSRWDKWFCSKTSNVYKWHTHCHKNGVFSLLPLQVCTQRNTQELDLFWKGFCWSYFSCSLISPQYWVCCIKLLWLIWEVKVANW